MAGPKQSGSGSQHPPAYDGAKFDVLGHCLKHPHIRLCKPKTSSTKEETRYVIVRKNCFLCGEHALCNERKLNRKARVHGYRPSKPEPRKKAPRGIVGTANASQRHEKDHRHGKKAAPSSPSRSKEANSNHPTPPVTPESAGSHTKDVTVTLVKEVAPPPLPAKKEGRRTTGRVRLHGTIPNQDGGMRPAVDPQARRASEQQQCLSPEASRFHYQAGKTDRRPQGRHRRHRSDEGTSNSDVARGRGKSQPRRVRSASSDEHSGGHSEGSHTVPRRARRGSQGRTRHGGRGKSEPRSTGSCKRSTATASTASLTTDERSGGDSKTTVKQGNGNRAKSVPRKEKKLTFMERIEHGMRV